MTSTRSALAIAFAFALVGCGLERPPDPPPLDCAAIDRAEERFPDECGSATDEDAGDEDAGDEDAGDEDAGP